ncbi:hypothetical protein [Xanthomonas phage XPV3]|nr:hypothetical protein [Xanthomonas phage XPV3]
MITQLRAIIAGVTLLVVLVFAGLLYWRGSSNATTKADLRTAREAIKVERATQQIAKDTQQQVNLAAAKTSQSAQAAANEIDQIRSNANRQSRASTPVGTTVAGGKAPVAAIPRHLDPSAPVRTPVSSDADRSVRGGDDARVLQLAREAREAARASSARLQSEGASAR